MRVVFFVFTVFFACMIAAGCKKPGNSITGGGKGGTCTLKVTGEAHGAFLDTCIVYIKYNAVNEPENGIYDDSCLCVVVNDTPFATFDSLTVGNYYLFAVGYHGAYSPPNVEGGRTVTISQSGSMVYQIMTAYQFIPAYPYILP